MHESTGAPRYDRRRLAASRPTARHRRDERRVVLEIAPAVRSASEP